MTDTVTLKGQSFKLKGPLIKEGNMLPDCELTNEELKPVKLSSFKGKVLLLITVPSLDTAVCSRETKKFNDELAKFKDQVVGVTVSMDLPFAQKRFCTHENVKNMITLSDYNKQDVGAKLGVLVPDLGLLARAVFVCDQNFTVRHVHLVKEITEEPNYEKVINEIQKLCQKSSNVKGSSV